MNQTEVKEINLPHIYIVVGGEHHAKYFRTCASEISFLINRANANGFNLIDYKDISKEDKEYMKSLTEIEYADFVYELGKKYKFINQNQ